MSDDVEISRRVGGGSPLVSNGLWAWIYWRKYWNWTGRGRSASEEASVGVGGKVSGDEGLGM